MGVTHLDIVQANEFRSESSTDGLIIPELSSNPTTLTDGELWLMNSGEVRIKTANGITELGGTASSSMDTAYNGGATITVDGGAVTLTDTQTTTGGALLITKSGKITSTHAASIFHINSTGAHDTSGDVKFLEISVGTETISGTMYGIEIDMNADADSAITATVGSVTISDGDFTASAIGRSATSGFTVTTANTTGDGMTFNIDSLTGGDGFIIDGDATGGSVNYFAVQEGSSNIFTITDDDALFNMAVEIDFDDADAFLVTTAANTEVLSIDTTMDAGDTCVDITSACTTGIGIQLTAATTTGSALTILADSATSGDAILISVASSTMTTAGSAISVIDSDNSDREVFAVRDNGTVYVYGVAEGTTAEEIGLGDLVITDGDVTIASGELAVSDGVTTAGSGIKLTSLMTTAGAAAGAAGALTIIAASATTGTVLSVTADALTSGDMLYLDNGGGTLSGGFYINCNDDNSSDFTVADGGATIITGAAAGTAALTLTTGDIVVTDTDSTTITSVNGTGSIVEIISGGAIGSDKACLEIDAAGTFNANGSLLRLSAENVTDTNSPFAMQIDCAATDMGAINIVTSPTTNSAIVATTAGILAADKAILELVSTADNCDADSSVLRVEQTHLSGESFCLTVKQDDLDVGFINFEGTATADANSPISTSNTTGTVTDFVRCAINGVKAWIAVSTNDPS